jgi:hypothetical protein
MNPGTETEEIKPEWRCRSASDCPVKWLVQIISFLSLPEKFIIRSVCKRLSVAGKEVLRDQKVIVLSLNKLPENSGLDQRNAMHFICKPKAVPGAGRPDHMDFDKLSDDRFKLLTYLKNLEKIIITDDLAAAITVPFDDRVRTFQMSCTPIVDLLIASNAHSLISLSRDGGCLPPSVYDDPDFVRLKELKCLQMTEQDIRRCPRLRKLDVRSADSLHHLPIDTIQELILGTFITHQTLPLRDEMDHLLQVVSRQTNLKVLQICRSATKFPDKRSSFKKRLLQNHRQLEVLSLLFDRAHNARGEELHEDEFVEQLVRTNPNLREIHNLYLTEKGIQSLCSLNHLKQVCSLRVSSYDQIIPTVMMMILSGNSCNCLQSIQIGLRYKSIPENPVAAEDIGRRLDHELQKAALPFKVSMHRYVTVTRSK